MSDDTDSAMPKPNVKRMHWPYPLIWLVPIAAAIGAGIYLRDGILERGTTITIDFDDATGVKESDTLASYRGVQIGKIEGIKLAGDNRHARISVRLLRAYRAFAKKGAQFWVVKADFSNGGLTGLGTIVSGAYIESRPGEGDDQTEFFGLDKPPVALGDGIHLFLHATRLEHLENGAPLKYKGIEVGAVQGIRLADDATSVEIEAFIQRRYAHLVRTNSQFWTESPADVKGGVFTGLEVKLGSVRSILTGSVSFASPPEKTGDAARDGAEFRLHSEMDKDWEKWSPTLVMPAQNPGGRNDAGDVKLPPIPSGK